MHLSINNKLPCSITHNKIVKLLIIIFKLESVTTIFKESKSFQCNYRCDKSLYYSSALIKLNEFSFHCNCKIGIDNGRDATQIYKNDKLLNSVYSL